MLALVTTQKAVTSGYDRFTREVLDMQHGSVVNTSSTESLAGSVGIQSRVTTDSCLALSESGIVSGIEEDIFTGAASIVFESKDNAEI